MEVVKTLIRFEALEPESLGDFRDLMKYAEINTCENTPQEIIADPFAN